LWGVPEHRDIKALAFIMYFHQALTSALKL